MNEVPVDEVSKAISDLSKSDNCPSLISMEFMHCPRCVRRQKKKRFGAPSIIKSKRKPDLDFIDAPDDNDNIAVVENIKKERKARGFQE